MSEIPIIEYFDLDKIDSLTEEKEHNLINKVILVLGSHSSGKTTLINDLIKKIQDELPTDFTTCIINNYDKEIIKNFINQQKNNIKDPEIKDPRSLLVIDNVNNNWINQNEFKFLFMNGRSIKITFIMSCQDLITLPSQFRANIDYTFICDNNNRDIVYKYYINGLKNKQQQFYDVLDEYTKNYSVVVVKNLFSSDNLEDLVFWYKTLQN